MSKEYDRINALLITLTDAFGYTGQGKHLDAFLQARKDLEDLIDEIDNAERC